jgi:phage terminase large subunit-like protein
MHLSDLEKVNNKDFAFYFDEDAATHPISLFDNLQFAKGSKEFFNLLDWQVFIMWCAYGWRRKSYNIRGEWTKDSKSDFRRYKQIYIKVARKNGKTEWMAGIGLYGQFFDPHTEDAEIYWFATKKEQAAKGFDRQKEMTNRLAAHSPAFALMARVMQYRIVSRSGSSFTTYLGQDSKGEDGAFPFYGICDEYHAHKTNGMLNVVESGMVSRHSPMTWIITTAGDNPESPCAQFEKFCKQGLDGVVNLGGVLPFIFDLDEEDDWKDEKNWSKPNPSLGQTVIIENLRDDYQRALSQGVSFKNNFLRKNLNIWLRAHSEWIAADVWQKNAGDETVDQLRESLKGRICFGGLDLALKSDLSAFALVFPPEKEGERIKILSWAFCPEDTAYKRAELDAVPYIEWAEQGSMILTPGNVTDFSFLKEKILEICQDYSVHSIGYDPYKSTQLITDLIENGVEMEVFAQKPAVISPATQEFERLALSESFAHGDDNVLKWCISNAVTTESAQGNIRLDKSRSSEKIDAAMAAVMACGQWAEHRDSNETKIYFAIL